MGIRGKSLEKVIKEEMRQRCLHQYMHFTEPPIKGDIDLSLLTYHPNHPLQTGEESL